MNNMQEISLYDCIDVYLPKYAEFMEIQNFRGEYSLLTIKAYKRVNKEFFDFVMDDGNYDHVSDIGKPIISAYFKHIQKDDESDPNNVKKGNGAATASLKLAAIESFFKWLSWEDKIEHNPIKAYKEKMANGGRSGTKAHRNPPVLQIVEIDNLFETILSTKHKNSKRDLALIGFLLDTGLRASEVEQVTLYKAKLLFDSGKLEIIGKGDKQRTIESQGIYSWTYSEYIDHLHASGHSNKQPIFLTTRGNPISQRTLHNIVNKYIELTGIDKPQTGGHLLRHCAASLMLHHGVDVMKVKRFLGHSSVQTTENYTHLL